MYERSAIVLERYLSKIFGQDETTGIKASYQIYTDILEEMGKYQIITEEEEKIIEEFDVIAQQMQTIQKKQEILCSDSIEQEEERNKLFNDFDQDPNSIEKKLLKTEKILDENAEEQKRLREEYVKLLNDFTEKQRERNRCSKTKRLAEANHMKILNETIEKIELISQETITKVKQFSALENEDVCQKLNRLMLENGKNEKVKFDQNVIKKAVETRIDIAKKEADCYLNSYDKLKKLMSEIEGDTIKLAKYQKVNRDIQIKLNFLEAQKEYIVSFLDNERMTSISGEKIHKQMMKEACQKYDIDTEQINNLYGLILREISGKATKKAYTELYNSTYLANIEQTEKNFNQEVNNIKANLGTIINTNYWRIEGIKNIYEVFNREVQEKFERDLTEFIPKEKDDEEEQVDEFEEEDEFEEVAPVKIQEPLLEEKPEFEEDEEEWFISNDEVEEEPEDNNNIEIDEIEDDDEDELDIEKNEDDYYETENDEENFEEDSDEEDIAEEDDDEDDDDDEMDIEARIREKMEKKKNHKKGGKRVKKRKDEEDRGILNRLFNL